MAKINYLTYVEVHEAKINVLNNFDNFFLRGGRDTVDPSGAMYC